MNNRKTTRGRKRVVQIIEKYEQRPTQIYGHGPQFKDNIGSLFSTHWADGSPIEMEVLVKRKVIVHRQF